MPARNVNLELRPSFESTWYPEFRFYLALGRRVGSAQTVLISVGDAVLQLNREGRGGRSCLGDYQVC